MSLLFGKRSLPARGAWIEIENEFTVAGPGCSRSPRGERGLKYRLHAYTTTIQRSLPARGAWIEIVTRYPCEACARASLPARGAWIEILHIRLMRFRFLSLPARGAWIEIRPELGPCPKCGRRSPRGERGLKSGKLLRPVCDLSSLPARGAWIEINALGLTDETFESLPARGAWIEIGMRSRF